MNLQLFTRKTFYHKNGIYWFQKIINNVIGEKNYDFLRMERRIRAAQIWYSRQEFLYYLNIHYPDVAYFLGTFPKIDTSNGIPHHSPWECFRDWQENTPNSDGWFAWVVISFCIWFCGYTAWLYLLPHYWADQPSRYENDLKLRIRDFYCTGNFEDVIGNQIMEYAYSPHNFANVREEIYQGLIHPDDARNMLMTTINRPNRYKEHYIQNYGNGTNTMTLPG